MGTVTPKKANYTSGELSPSLVDRSDIIQYISGADKMRNVFVIPQGGFKRRPGLAYQFTAEVQPVLTYTHNPDPPYTGTREVEYSALETGVPLTAQDLFVVLEDFGTLEQGGSVLPKVGLQILVLGTDYGVDTTAKSISLVAILARGSTIYITTNLSSYTEALKGVDDTGGSRIRMFEFEFSNVQTYLFVFTPFTLNIYKVVSGRYALMKMMNVPFGNAMHKLNIAQNLDSLVVFHERHKPQHIKRGVTDTDWTREDYGFTFYPQYDFDDTLTQSEATDHVEHIRFAIGSWNSNSRYALIVNGEETNEIIYVVSGEGGEAQVAGFMQAALRALEGVSSLVTVTHVRDRVYACTFADGDGRKYTFAESFEDKKGFAHDNNEIRFITHTKGKGKLEDAFSAVRGWPSCGVFFQGRLWLAGSYFLPQSIWASRSGSFTDFNTTEVLDDYAIMYTANTNKVSAFYNISVGRHLQFFSSSGEFYTPISIDEVITPTNFSVRRTSQKGSKLGLRVFDVAGGVSFIQRFGKSVQEFLFEDATQAYNPISLSKFSGHLLSDPIGFAYRPAISTDEADYLYVVNDDFSLAVFNTIREENVNAWSLITTNGDFLDACVVDVDSIFAVRRDVQVGDDIEKRVFVEMFEDDLYVDSGISGIGSEADTGGLEHIKGQEVAIILDNSVQVSPPDWGETPILTFARESVSTWQAGLPFPDVSDDGSGYEMWVRNLPIEIEPGGQSIRGEKLSITQIALTVLNSSHVECRVEEGEIYSFNFREFGDTLLDVGLPTFTGVKKIQGMQNSTEQGRLSIFQTQPLGLTVLGMTMKVNF